MKVELLPTIHECRQLEVELKKVWKLDHGHYNSFCGTCEPLKAVKIVAIIDLILAVILGSTYAATLFLVDYMSLAVYLGIIITFINVLPILLIDIISSSLLLYGIHREKSIFFFPFLFKSFGKSLGSILMGAFVISRPNLINCFYLVVCLTHIFLTQIVWNAYQYVTYKEVWQKISDILAKNNHCFNDSHALPSLFKYPNKIPSKYLIDVEDKHLIESDKL